MSRVLYVAGPYTGATAWQREQNIRAAEEVTLECWKAGVPAVCVHAIARHFFGAVEEQQAIDIDFVLLSRCDGVLLVSGWQKSKGTLAEIEWAKRNDIPVFEMAPAAISWALEWTEAAR